MVGNGEIRAAEPPAGVEKILVECVGCKWTLHILRQVRAGVNRPGALERTAPGLTAKVLSERLVKLVGFGLFERRAYPEIPPRVEYHLTPFGERFVLVLDQLEQLRAEFGAAEVEPSAGGG